MRRFGNLSVVILLVALIGACASSGYPAASAQYDAESRTYQDAYDKLMRAKSNGTLTHAQDEQAGLIVADVRVADRDTYADLQAWKSSGKEPPTFSANAQKLRRAQGELIYLASEVR